MGRAPDSDQGIFVTGSDVAMSELSPHIAGLGNNSRGVHLTLVHRGEGRAVGEGRERGWSPCGAFVYTAKDRARVSTALTFTLPCSRSARARSSDQGDEQHQTFYTRIALAAYEDTGDAGEVLYPCRLECIAIVGIDAWWKEREGGNIQGGVCGVRRRRNVAESVAIAQTPRTVSTFTLFIKPGFHAVKQWIRYNSTALPLLLMTSIC